MVAESVDDRLAQGCHHSAFTSLSKPGRSLSTGKIMHDKPDEPNHDISVHRDW